MATLEERLAAMQAAQAGGQQPPVAGATPVQEPNGPIEQAAIDVVGSFNVGIANLLGSPGNLFHAALSKAGLADSDAPAVYGSDRLRGFLANIGAAPAVGTEPKGLVPRAARIAGENLIPAMGARAYGANLTTRLPTALNDVQKALVAAYNSPLKAASGEAVAIGGAALGGEIADTSYPDNYVASIFGELIGGLTPGALVSAGAKLPGPSVVKSILAGEGASRRATTRVQDVTGNVEAVRQGLFDESVLKLDPYTATGDAGLLALRKSAMDSDPKLAARLADATDMSYWLARRNVLNTGGNPDDVIEYLSAIRMHTAAKSQEAINKLKTDVDPVSVSRIVRTEIENSLTRARKDENAIWSKLPTKGIVDPSNVANTFDNLLANRSFAADAEDIPQFVYDLVGTRKVKEGVESFEPGKLIKTPELGAMKDFRSRLQQEIAIERAKDAPNRNKMRILGELQDSVYSSLTKASPEYAAAVDFSRKLNESFTRGKIGDLLGYEKTGELRTSQEGTLDFLLAGNKDDVRMGIRQIAQASPEAMPAISNGIKSMFMTQATDRASGALNVNAARRFLEKNKETLAEFPDVKAQIEQSIRTQKVTDDLFGASVGNEVSTYIKDKSVASLYLDGTPDTAMHRLVTAKNSQGAGAIMRQMLQLTAQDPSGRATKGLKAAFGQYLLRHSETGDINVLSGKKFISLLDQLKEPARVLYTPDEYVRLVQVGNELRKLEAAATAAPQAGGVISDMPSKIISIVGGTLSARAGAKLGAGTSGASLRTASIASREFQEVLGRLTNDGAQQMILNSIEDPLVFRTLMMEPTPENLRKANKVFNSFLTGNALSAPSRESEQETLEMRLNRLARDSRETMKALQ